jgi:hypothetical protein
LNPSSGGRTPKPGRQAIPIQSAPVPLHRPTPLLISDKDATKAIATTTIRLSQNWRFTCSAEHFPMTNEERPQ